MGIVHKRVVLGFCPTGAGGGVDNSCSSSAGGGADAFKVGQAVTPKDLKAAGFKFERQSGLSSSVYKHPSGVKVTTKDDPKTGKPVSVKSIAQPRQKMSEQGKREAARNRELRKLERNRLYPSD